MKIYLATVGPGAALIALTESALEITLLRFGISAENADITAHNVPVDQEDLWGNPHPQGEDDDCTD